MAKVEPRCPACLGELKPHVNQGVLFGFTCLDPSCRRAWNPEDVSYSEGEADKNSGKEA